MEGEVRVLIAMNTYKLILRHVKGNFKKKPLIYCNYNERRLHLNHFKLYLHFTAGYIQTALH